MKKQQKQDRNQRNAQRPAPKARRNPVYPYHLSEISDNVPGMRIKGGRRFVLLEVEREAGAQVQFQAQHGRSKQAVNSIHRRTVQDLLSVLNFSFKEVQRELQSRGGAV